MITLDAKPFAFASSGLVPSGHDGFSVGSGFVQS